MLYNTQALNFMSPGCLFESWWLGRAFLLIPGFLVCQMSTFAAISVNLTSSFQYPFKFAATWKISLPEHSLKLTGFESISKSILVAQSCLFPESVKVCSYKFQTKFWMSYCYTLKVLTLFSYLRFHYLFINSTNIYWVPTLSWAPILW